MDLLEMLWGYQQLNYWHIADYYKDPEQQEQGLNRGFAVAHMVLGYYYCYYFADEHKGLDYLY